MHIATLYDLLGVESDASHAAIRAAYRRSARQHHPDRAGEQSSARMAEINRAWQVLGDPARRRDYDLELPEPRATYAEPAFNPLAGYQDPPRFPWRFMGVLALLGSLFVIIGLATAADPTPPVVDNILRPGDCVSIQANGDAAERLCSEAHDGVVVVLLTTDQPCPADAEPHRDQQGLGIVCVRPG